MLDMESIETKYAFNPPWGEYLVSCSDGDVLFSRVSFSPIFPRTGYQKKAVLVESVVKTCLRGHFFRWRSGNFVF